MKNSQLKGVYPFSTVFRDMAWRPSYETQIWDSLEYEPKHSYCITTTRDKNNVFFFFFGKQKWIEFEGIRAILWVALDGVDFCMSVGIKSMPRYGLEVGFRNFWGIENIFCF